MQKDNIIDTVQASQDIERACNCCIDALAEPDTLLVR